MGGGLVDKNSFFPFWNEYSKTVESGLNPRICVSQRIEMIRILMNIPKQLLAKLQQNAGTRAQRRNETCHLCQYSLREYL